MKTTDNFPGLQLRVVLEPNIAIGPGKADLLEGIKETGSISAAGKGMGMSYKRAWLLVDTMNRCFKEPLVETSRGGQSGGGATLTPTGELVLENYRVMQANTDAAIAPQMRILQAHVSDDPDAHK